MNAYGKRPFLLLLVVFILLNIGYIWVIPPFEGPDGPEHVAYVLWLAEGYGFPPQGEAAWATPMRQEASQPPLYYGLASLPARFIELAEPTAVYRPNPHFPSTAPGTVPDNKNVAVHYGADTWPLRGGWLALYLARIVSLLLGITLLVATYGLGRQLMPDQPQLAMAATAWVAFTPQVLFLSSVVTNDLLAAVTGTLTLWLLALNIRQKPTVTRTWLLGVAFGLAALSKTTALALGVPLVAGWLWLWLSRRVAYWPLFGYGVSLLLGALPVAGWWYWRSWRLYGSPFGLDTHCYAPWAFCGTPLLRANPWREWQEVFFSFWAAFGWGNIKLPAWVYVLIALLILLAAVGFIQCWRKGQSTDRALYGLLLLSLLVTAVSLEVWMRQVTAPHGRLLFVVVGGVAVLLVRGWATLWFRLPGMSVTGMVIMAVWSLFGLIQPAYARPQPLTEWTGPAINWQFGEMAILQRVTPSYPSVQAGEVLPIEVCWRTIAPANRDYSVLVHLVGPNDGVVASRHTYPGLGSYPTSDWMADVLFCDLIRLDTPADLAQTLLYKVEIGWLDDETGQRLPAFGADGELLSQTFVETVRLQAATAVEVLTPPDGTNTIRLLASDVPPIWQAGEQQALSLSWWLAEEVSTDYTTFVHLRNQETDEIVAQADGPPLDNWYPTSAWQVGEVVVDDRFFVLPANTLPGTYDLVVGWYDPVSVVRLGDEIRLTAVEVRP